MLTGLRGRIDSGHVIAIVALVVALGGGAYAGVSARSVGTKELKPRAVTPPKIAASAVKTKKIADDAVTGAKVDEASLGTVPNAAAVDGMQASAFLSANAAGVPVAGANVDADGNVRRFFNRLGGAPTVTSPNTGLYNVSFPGLQGQVSFDRAIVLVSLNGGNLGQISRTSTGGAIRVGTGNEAGAFLDRAFEVVVFLRG